MNTPKIERIHIAVMKVGSLLYACAIDGATQYRGDCISPERSDIDAYIAEWEQHAQTVTVEELETAFS